MSWTTCKLSIVSGVPRTLPWTRCTGPLSSVAEIVIASDDIEDAAIEAFGGLHVAMSSRDGLKDRLRSGVAFVGF